MVWEITGKVILITGGAGGIGLCTGKELLRQGAKGVALCDINIELGEKALIEIFNEFGEDRAIFLKTDVTAALQFREAFEETIKKFKNIDVLINNAGFLNEILWERSIAVNVCTCNNTGSGNLSTTKNGRPIDLQAVNGTINGMLLGLHEYLPKYKQGATGVIVNVSSVAGLIECSSTPVYAATKYAIHGLTKAWGARVHFEKTGIRVIGICPGLTDTEIMKPVMEEGVLFNDHYREILSKAVQSHSIQTPEKCAEALCEVLRTAKTGSIWVAEGSNPPYEFIFPDREAFNPSSSYNIS